MGSSLSSIAFNISFQIISQPTNWFPGAGQRHKEDKSQYHHILDGKQFHNLLVKQRQTILCHITQIYPLHISQQVGC